MQVLLLPEIAAAPLLCQLCRCSGCCCPLLVLDCRLIVSAGVTKDVVILIYRRRCLPSYRLLGLPVPIPSTPLISRRCSRRVLELAVHLDAVLLPQGLPLPSLHLLLAAACRRAGKPNNRRRRGVGHPGSNTEVYSKQQAT
jgi:hypothetical protein